MRLHFGKRLLTSRCLVLNVMALKERKKRKKKKKKSHSAAL